MRKIERAQNEVDVESMYNLFLTTWKSFSDAVGDDTSLWFKVNRWKKDALINPVANQPLNIVAKEQNGLVVGAAVVTEIPYSDNRAELPVIAVAETFRGLGISQSMLEFIDSECRQLGFKALLLDTNTNPEMGGATEFWDKDDKTTLMCDVPDYLEKDSGVTGRFYYRLY